MSGTTARDNDVRTGPRSLVPATRGRLGGGSAVSSCRKAFSEPLHGTFLDRSLALLGTKNKDLREMPNKALVRSGKIQEPSSQ